MSIGIYDMDVSTYTLVPFNLEAMKLSTYYKKNNQVVVLAPSFTPEKNTKFIVRKDYNDGNFPPLIGHENVSYGGFAFSNNIYKPLPIEVEKCKPDTTLYSKLEKTFLEHGDTDHKRIFKTQFFAEHLRLSLDGKRIWPQYGKQFKNLARAKYVIFHDYDLNAIEGAYTEVQKIVKNGRHDGFATRFGMKFPVQVATGEDLLKWSSLSPNRTFFSIKLNGIVDDFYWREYILSTFEKSTFYNLEWDVTASLSSQHEFAEKIRQVLRQVIYARSKRVNFSLKYNEDFFFDKRWIDVIKFIQFYLSSLTGARAEKYFNALPSDTPYDFAKHVKVYPPAFYGPEAMTKEQVRRVFYFVRENSPELFTDFYECSLNTLLEGKNDWF